MGTVLKRNDFKKQYSVIKQGMFIFEKEKHIPKDQPIINIGKEISSALMKIEAGQRKDRAPDILREIIDDYNDVTLEHIEVLFTPSLEIDPAACILKLCRNRKICYMWPGEIKGEQLFYEQPGNPEYYAQNYRAFIDTYIILGGM